eukprot:GFYU01010763.1.p1 GENE.GFYU01010763.1~~GFYU01010763.1.p1  ORF type:complete len:128 (+),score=11.66 GFYU01010763.1:137-520(+)
MSGVNATATQVAQVERTETVDSTALPQPAEEQSVVTLTLQPRPNEEDPQEVQHVRWTDETIDNEHMNKKKTKKCCIYHKPKRWDESSSESSSDDDGRARPSRASGSGSRDHGHGHDHGHDHGHGHAH